MSAWRTASRDTLRRAVLLGGEVGHVGDHVPRPRHRVGRRLDEGSVGGQPTQLGGVAEEHLPRWHGPSFQRLPRRRSILRSRRRVTAVSAQPTCPGPLRPGAPQAKRPGGSLVTAIPYQRISTYALQLLRAPTRPTFPEPFTSFPQGGTHATNMGSSGPSSRGPPLFLGVMCWLLLDGVDNAWRNEGLCRAAGRCPAVFGGRPRPGG